MVQGARPVVALVGYNSTVLRAFARAGGPEVVVLEEPDVWRGPGLQQEAATFDLVRSVELVEYQQRTDPEPLAAALPGPVDAVLPGAEYGVEAAAALAEHLGLPGAGSDAARVLRDKISLRDALVGTGLSDVAYTEVTGPGDVAAFLTATGGPVVLKPANRQASVGVSVVRTKAEVLRAWRACTAAEEPHRVADRPMRWRYVAEEALEGTEVSVEALVRDGEVLWVNLTRKTTLSADRPVEVAHLVGDRDPAWRRRVDVLAKAVGYRDGMLHSEWMVDARGDARIIECAGRAPGDRITELVDLAYGCNVLAAWADLLLGRPVDLPQEPARWSTIHFLPPQATGMLVGLEGLDAAAEVPGVVTVEQCVEPGRLLDGCRSSWDRLASVVAVGDTQDAATQAAQESLRRISARVLA